MSTVKEYFRKLNQKFNCSLLSSSLLGLKAQNLIISCRNGECKKCDAIRLRAGIQAIEKELM